MDALHHYIRQGFRDLDMYYPWYLWWPALFYVAAIFAILLWLRARTSFRVIWVVAMAAFVLGTLLYWRSAVGTGTHRSGASGPEGLPGLSFVVILLLVAFPLIMASAPLLILTSLIPPVEIDWRAKIAVSVAVVSLTIVMFVSMFNKAAERREQFLKSHPEAAEYRIVQ